MATNNDIAIRLTGLTKTYGSGSTAVQALRGVDMTIRRGEVVGLVGPSGSGKSTFLRCCNGLEQAEAGRIDICGRTLVQDGRMLPDRELNALREEVGMVFQSFNLFPHLSVLDNVAFGLRARGVARADAADQAREWLVRLGVVHLAARRPGELSGGQMQRVAIARSLVNSPGIILADEPTGNLDLKTGAAIVDLLHTLCRECGVTVVTVTHDHKMLAASDRIVWFADGRVDRIQTRDDVEIRFGHVAQEA